MSEPDGVLFTDGRSRVFFRPPEPDSGDHGFHHRVDVVAGPFQGSIDASSYAPLAALDGFLQQLVDLHRNLKGKAHLPASYDNFRLSLEGDGLGHIAVEATLHADALSAGAVAINRLNFSFRIDQTQLPAIIGAIERIFINRAGS